MAKQLVKVLLLAMLGNLCQAWFFGSSNDEPNWNGLRAGFRANQFKAFTELPRTEFAAQDEGWTKDASVGCDVAGTAFNGNRYMKDNDPATMLLFDKNGYIAGIQAGIPKTLQYPKKQNAKYHVFSEESDKWVITAYFVEPESICTAGRTASQFASQGTGTMLAIQNGSTASSLMRMPLSESRVLPDTDFIQGKCFWWMGMHYWYDVSKTMSCDDTFPVFLMYNGGKLNSFGWAFNPNFEESSTWEHPTASVFGSFIKDPPTCLGADGPVTTLHVYLTDSPRSNYC